MTLDAAAAELIDNAWSYILVEGKLVKVPVMTATVWFDEQYRLGIKGDRVIGYDVIRRCEVSTELLPSFFTDAPVLGLNMNNERRREHLFETMVFAPPDGRPVGLWRYGTPEKAMHGHDAVVAMVRRGEIHGAASRAFIARERRTKTALRLLRQRAARRPQR